MVLRFQVKAAAGKIYAGMKSFKRGFHMVAFDCFFDLSFNRRVKKGRPLAKTKRFKKVVVSDESTGTLPDPPRFKTHVTLAGETYEVPNMWGVPPFLELIEG
jgi:hypothetical protein